MESEQDNIICTKIRYLVDKVSGSVDDWMNSSLHPWYTERMSSFMGKWEGLDCLVQVVVMFTATVLMMMGIARGVQWVRR